MSAMKRTGTAEMYLENNKRGNVDKDQIEVRSRDRVNTAAQPRRTVYVQSSKNDSSSKRPLQSILKSKIPSSAASLSGSAAAIAEAPNEGAASPGQINPPQVNM